jgi:hypothetical protein
MEPVLDSQVTCCAASSPPLSASPAYSRQRRTPAYSLFPIKNFTPNFDFLTVMKNRPLLIRLLFDNLFLPVRYSIKYSNKIFWTLIGYRDNPSQNDGSPWQANPSIFVMMRPQDEASLGRYVLSTKRPHFCDKICEKSETDCPSARVCFVQGTLHPGKAVSWGRFIWGRFVRVRIVRGRFVQGRIVRVPWIGSYLRFVPKNINKRCLILLLSRILESALMCVNLCCWWRSLQSQQALEQDQDGRQPRHPHQNLGEGAGYEAYAMLHLMHLSLDIFIPWWAVCCWLDSWWITTVYGGYMVLSCWQLISHATKYEHIQTDSEIL